MVVVIVGESASGKTTLAKELEKNYGFERIVTYTTRPKRDYEIGGVDYHFISDEEYSWMLEDGEFAEVGNYNGWMYGSAKKDYQSGGDKVIVLTPKGLRSVKRNGIECFSVLLSVPRRDRLIKMLQRLDNIEESYRRNVSDVGMFDGVEDEVDFVLGNADYKYSPKELAFVVVHSRELRDCKNAEENF